MAEPIERTPRRRFLQTLATLPTVASLAAFEPARLHAAAQAVSGLSDDEVARDERFWFGVQQAFSLDARHAILNAGASDPMPRSVLEAFIRDTEFINASPLVNGRVIAGERERIRQQLARHVGCEPEEIAITRGTTEGFEHCDLGPQAGTRRRGRHDRLRLWRRAPGTAATRRQRRAHDHRNSHALAGRRSGDHRRGVSARAHAKNACDPLQPRQ